MSPQCLALLPHEDIVTKKATEHTSTCPLHRTPSETAQSEDQGRPLQNTTCHILREIYDFHFTSLFNLVSKVAYIMWKIVYPVCMLVVLYLS